jgi:hypothetical protein
MFNEHECVGVARLKQLWKRQLCVLLLCRTSTPLLEISSSTIVHMLPGNRALLASVNQPGMIVALVTRLSSCCCTSISTAALAQSAGMLVMAVNTVVISSMLTDDLSRRELGIGLPWTKK